MTEEPGISFYVGLPVLVDDTPVGTVCAIDTTSRELTPERRAQLFGLLGAVESHLEVIYQHGKRTVEHGLSSKLTAIRALAAKEWTRGTKRQGLRHSLRDLEAEAATAFDMLKDTSGDAETDGVGMEDTEVERIDEETGLGYAETEVEWMDEDDG